MKRSLIAALALSLVLAQVVSVSAYAAQPVVFRSAEAKTFSASELQSYGLNGADAAKVEQLQKEGYTVKVMSKEDAQKYHAGEWGKLTWVVGGIVVVVVVAALLASTN